MSRSIEPSLLEAASGLPFVKVTGGGNDFVLADNRNRRLAGDLASLARLLCDRGFGVGADGLILIENAPLADLRMVYFNRDGSAADLCGNGLRCLARWAATTGGFAGRIRVETGAGILEACGSDDPPWFALPLAGTPPARRTLAIGARKIEGVFVRAGVPHFVVEVADAHGAGVLDDAPALRAHPDLGPGGANVDFYTPRPGGVAAVRFWERGVEGETLSSGSGCISVAVAADHTGRLRSPVRCVNRRGVESRVTLEGAGEKRVAVLAGEARILFNGRVRREMLASATRGGPE